MTCFWKNKRHNEYFGITSTTAISGVENSKSCSSIIEKQKGGIALNNTFLNGIITNDVSTAESARNPVPGYATG